MRYFVEWLGSARYFMPLGNALLFAAHLRANRFVGVIVGAIA